MYARFILYDINKFQLHNSHPYALCICKNTHTHVVVIFAYFFPLCMHEPYKLLLYLYQQKRCFYHKFKFTVADIDTQCDIWLKCLKEENTRPDETWKLDKFQITPFYQCQFLFEESRRNRIKYRISSAFYLITSEKWKMENAI